ncbi:MAG TPA: hypothetical protein DCS83_08085 [Prevotella sp.]|jgi:fucose 4-O-acetylase-like acetyltransferase|nr:hypothetical protein [Prevotella sp.]
MTLYLVCNLSQNEVNILKKVIALSVIISLFYLFKKGEIIESRYSFSQNILSLLGMNSLDIYIFHYFLLHICDVKILKTWVMTSQNYLLEFIITLLIALLISYTAIGIGKILKSSNLIYEIVYGNFAKKLMITNNK